MSSSTWQNHLGAGGSPGVGPGGGPAGPPRGAAPTYLRPDSMNLSYSTDILQHSAWRVCTAEQLVLTTWPPAGSEDRAFTRAG